MKAIVLGAGVTGVATAWYLKPLGYEVTVIDRVSGPAMETSFANAGELSFAYSTPWAAPGIPQKALKWMVRTHSPLVIHPDGSCFQMKWLRMMRANCTAARYRVNKERMVRITEYSRELFANFEEETGVHFEGRRKGTLQVFRHEKEVRAAKKDLAVLAEYGVPYRELPARRRTLEFVVHDLFPNGGDLGHAQFWSGLRPTTPDSVPLLGASGWDNLTLNTGHGTLGWTMSLGSGKVAADLASGLTPAIRTDDLGIGRYRA